MRTYRIIGRLTAPPCHVHIASRANHITVRYVIRRVIATAHSART
jgi:hypothetical protein